MFGFCEVALLKRAAEERNARTSEQMRVLAARVDHPWQHPEFIKAHSKRVCVTWSLGREVRLPY